MCLWAITYSHHRSAFFCCRKIYKTLTDSWMWELGLRPRNFSFWEYMNGIFVAVHIDTLTQCACEGPVPGEPDGSCCNPPHRPRLQDQKLQIHGRPLPRVSLFKRHRISRRRIIFKIQYLYSFYFSLSLIFKNAYFLLLQWNYLLIVKILSGTFLAIVSSVIGRLSLLSSTVLDRGRNPPKTEYAIMHVVCGFLKEFAEGGKRLSISCFYAQVPG
jgi:hypothetical protein